MEKAEMKLVELDSADVITTNGGGDGILRAYNFGNEIPNDAYFTFGGEGKAFEIYNANSSKIDGTALADILNKALGFQDTITSDTKFVNSSVDSYRLTSDLWQADNNNSTPSQIAMNGEYLWGDGIYGFAFYHQ